MREARARLHPSKSDLAGRPLHPIELNEHGAKVSSLTTVWTGTLLGGAPATLHTCQDWTSKSNSDWGGVGYVDATPGSREEWTGPDSEALVDQPCNTPRSLYCFEQ